MAITVARVPYFACSDFSHFIVDLHGGHQVAHISITTGRPDDSDAIARPLTSVKAIDGNMDGPSAASSSDVTSATFSPATVSPARRRVTVRRRSSLKRLWFAGSSHGTYRAPLTSSLPPKPKSFGRANSTSSTNTTG